MKTALTTFLEKFKPIKSVNILWLYLTSVFWIQLIGVFCSEFVGDSEPVPVEPLSQQFNPKNIY